MQATHLFNGKAMLAISVEMSCGNWKVAATDQRRERPSQFNAAESDPMARLEQVARCVEQLKAKWQLPGDCEVALIYEAGQEGFWPAREMTKRRWRVHVVDAASVPVPRQAKRRKTDRLDALVLLDNLLAWLRGERRHELRMVHIPSEQDEALRQLPRDRGELQKEVGQHRDRIRKLLRTVGCWQEVTGLQQLQQLCCADGRALALQLRHRIEREFDRLLFAQGQLAELERELQQQLPPPVVQKIEQLATLRGIGHTGAMRLVLEFFWRDFDNRRQVGSCLGLVPQPYNSGASEVDQGISKQGNRRVRALMIEMSWFWLKYQPDSAIAQWFAARTGGNARNKRGKRIAIVAVARRLAIALWRFLQDGLIPQGATLKKA